MIKEKKYFPQNFMLDEQSTTILKQLKKGQVSGFIRTLIKSAYAQQLINKNKEVEK